ncbi:DNA recombination protein RmuC [uncultured Helicobacter sp.]|mgnify:CR=1 FL=1|uniref:DNA recombination protein RmuC n=3 Tax=uncultured Helicobacter sp. TaxID=175537 RepID=UPI0025CDC247|nr:DNA recombination protein RmuC [uncultured Helicobacter sp.]
MIYFAITCVLILAVICVYKFVSTYTEKIKIETKYEELEIEIERLSKEKYAMKEVCDIAQETKIKLEAENKHKNERIEELLRQAEQMNKDKNTIEENYSTIHEYKIKLEADNKNKEVQICNLNKNIGELEEHIEQIRKENQSIKDDNARFKATNEANEKRINELNNDIEREKAQHKDMFESIQKGLEKYIKLQDDNVLKKVELIFNRDSKKALDDVFIPIKKTIQEYSVNLRENEANLKGQIKSVFEYARTMQETTESLSKILKGDKKVRGNFGEIQLKNVLENSGLIEGEQYKLQTHFKDGNKGYKPDAVVFLDGGAENDNKRRNIIIDSKFPLPDDLTLTSDSDMELESRIAKEIAKNLKYRIDELADKPYREFNDYTYDYVLLFLPYNNILDLALSADHNIYQYAYSKKIYLVTPHTLFMALKTIHISWTYIQREKSVQSAFKEINAFYEKFATAIESFQGIQKHFKSLGDDIDKLDKQLVSGRGNLCGKFESLKNFGATPKKNLPNVEGE